MRRVEGPEPRPWSTLAMRLVAAATDEKVLGGKPRDVLVFLMVFAAFGAIYFWGLPRWIWIGAYTAMFTVVLAHSLITVARGGISALPLGSTACVLLGTGLATYSLLTNERTGELALLGMVLSCGATSLSHWVARHRKARLESSDGQVEAANLQPPGAG